MFTTILVPTDGSPGAESAVARALDLARTYEADVHALYVVDERGETGTLETDERDRLHDSVAEQGHEATIAVQERAETADVAAVREVREGIPHRTILEYADEHGVDLVVMGTHGTTGAENAALGSTTSRVVRLSPVPVLAVPLDGEVPESGYGLYDHVVIPTDGSDAAERAAEAGLEIAERYGADVHVVYVVDTTTYDLVDAPRSIVGLLKEGGRNAVDAIAAEARDRNLPATAEVLRGQVETELLEYAEGVGADLVTMGTRGRTAGADADRLLGSTTARMIRRSSVPVLTVS